MAEKCLVLAVNYTYTILHTHIHTHLHADLYIVCSKKNLCWIAKDNKNTRLHQ